MELRQLRYFLAVAEELHFGRAAERLGIGQPPLSQQIQRFEQQLGVQLFERSRRGVTLTRVGEMLLPEAREICSRAERAIMLVERVSRGESGQLSLGFVGSATLSVLPEIIRRFRERLPDVELLLQELTSREQVAALHDGRIEVGLARAPAPPDAIGIASMTVLRERLVLALPESLGQNLPPVVSLAAVADAPFILSPRTLGPGFYDSVIGLCQQAGFSPRVIQEAVQMQTIIGLVAAGIGVALVPASLRRFHREGVVYRDLDGTPVFSELAAIWLEGEMPVVVKHLVEMATVVGSEMAASA